MHTLLQQLFETKTVPNTLLFCGPLESGKEAAALDLATALMGEQHARKLNLGNHPDYRLFRPEGKMLQHPIEAMRTLIDEVPLPPFEAPVRFFVLTQAERMLPTSSNALLKTLEEPLPHAYILLLTEHPDALLPTIISRCRRIDFTAPKATPAAHPLLSELLTQSLTHHRRLSLLADLEKEFEERDSTDAVFEQLLTYHRDRPTWQRALKLVERCRLALDRSIKLRVVLEYFFLKIS